MSAPDVERQPDEQRQPAPERPAGYVDLNQGDHCPVCRVGILLKIAEAPNSVTLKCFSCGRQGSFDPEVGHKLHTTHPRETPTGLTLSRAQYEAQQSEAPEEAAASARQPEAGSGVSPPREGLESG